MDLSPNDIRNYEFRTQMRGYDKDEVEGLLDQAAGALDELKQENLKLSMQVESLNSQLSSLRQFEETIKSAAIDARRNADATVSTARQEAEMILSKARKEAESILEHRTREVDTLETQIAKLGMTKSSYLSKLRGLIKSHLQLVEEVAHSEIDVPQEVEVQPKQNPDNLDVTESTDVTTESRESLANESDDEEESVTSPEFDEEEEESTTDDSSDEVEQLQQNADEEPAPEEKTPEVQAEAPAESEPTEGDSPIDPELAAALEQYKSAARQEKPDSVPAGPRPGELVETTARAEDIPPGFIAKEDEIRDMNATDKMPPSQTNASAEPNSIDVDAADKPALEPEKLAEELDEVAEQLDEKLEKVEQK